MIILMGFVKYSKTTICPEIVCIYKIRCQFLLEIISLGKSVEVASEVVCFGSPERLEFGGWLEVVGLCSVCILFLCLFVFLLNRCQLLVAVLLVLSFRPPRVDLSAQRRPLVNPGEVKFLVDRISVGTVRIVIHQFKLLVLRQKESLVLVPSLVKVVF